MGYGFGPANDSKPSPEKPKRPVYGKDGNYSCPYCGNKLTLHGLLPGWGPGFGPGAGQGKGPWQKK